MAGTMQAGRAAGSLAPQEDRPRPRPRHRIIADIRQPVREVSVDYSIGINIE